MSFMVPTNHTNPPDNKIIFEQYFGERFSEDTYLVGRKIINLHFEIHRKKRAAHPEDLGAAENVR